VATLHLPLGAFTVETLTRLSFLAGVTVAGLSLVTPRAQEAPTVSPAPLPVVLSRAASYIEAYAGSFSGLVVEEAYVQDVQQVNRFGFRLSIRTGPVHRTLRSDLLLLRPSGSDAWMQFRDVFEVDGKPVRDRNDRLAKLFLEPSKSTAAQADKIIRESARYNIGDIERTINLPVLAMTVLDRRMQANFQFHVDDTPVDAKDLPKSPSFAVPEDALVVSFDETAVRTMIATPQGKNLRSHGRFWLEMPAAEVLMTELRVDDYSLGAAIHVAYQTRPGIKVRVPVEMHELYENHLNSQKVEGTATYSNFRQFNVKVDEEIATPK
jgi:hypothetical protein